MWAAVAKKTEKKGVYLWFIFEKQFHATRCME